MITLFHRVGQYIESGIAVVRAKSRPWMAIAAGLLMLSPLEAQAFKTDIYARESVLASGRWVKVSVTKSGLHCITNEELRQRGFSDPSKVNVYGYGGQRISDILTFSNYTDDLPLLQSARTDRGIVFYAKGPETWNLSGNRYSHTLNPFSQYGYYYLSDREVESRTIPREDTAVKGAAPLVNFNEKLFHEVDQVSMGLSGHLLLGEDLRRNPNLILTFQLPDRVEDTEVWMKTQVVTNTVASSSLSFTANGEELPGTHTIASTNKNYGRMATVTKSFDLRGNKLDLGIKLSITSSSTGAYLDFVDVNYVRALKLSSGLLEFSLSGRSATLSGAGSSTILWDVTDPTDIKAMNTLLEGDEMSWTNTFSGTRHYVAWNPDALLPAPQYVETVPNQNLHDPSVTPDMVIFTPIDWASQAQRLADFHANSPDSLKVVVVKMDELFNEFSSGTRDAGAIRRILKMYYDRGTEAGKPLRYALLFGRATFDNRLLTSEMKNLNHPMLPTWESDDGLSETESYTSDDIFSFLEDGSGVKMGSDKLSIAVGRVPARSVQEARNFVDKVIEYSTSSPKGNWKNQIVIVADDGDSGEHMEQANDMFSRFTSHASGRNMAYTKIYVDAYPEIGGYAQGAHDRLHRALDEGVLLWNYIGHASANQLGSEGILNYADIDKLTLSHYPVLFAATCYFFRWDNNSQCGGEGLLSKTRGGIVGGISATRSVFIIENAHMANYFGEEAFKRGTDGRLPTLGEAYRNAKNRLTGNRTNTNKLRYVLMGDPAMRFVTPESTAELEYVCGATTNTEESDYPVIQARQQAVVEGSLYDTAGNQLNDFDGTLTVQLYDAEYSITTEGRPSDDTEGEPVTFEQQGDKLYQGSGRVEGGTFKINIPMPSEISDNFRPAMLNMYALSDNGQREAIGVSRNFYVYGYDDSAAPDDVAPEIEYAYLNHETFQQGGTVNENPMFIASVKDDVGINLSTAGIGHQMTIQVDNRRVFNDVALYYTPASDGTPGGTINYPMQTLEEGNHTLSFRVWDTSGNSASKELSFFVEPGAAPQLFDVYTDANPATDLANFYLTHNRPDQEVTVTVSIYNLLGRLIWTSTSTDRSDMFSSAPISWDLRDMGGHRVPRGIYIYRATLSSPNSNHEESVAKRIAVAAP